MDHQDIMDLISAGEFEKANELRRERTRKSGISGDDAQVMGVLEKKIRARLAAAVTVKILTVPPIKKAKKPSKTPRRTRRGKDK